MSSRAFCYVKTRRWPSGGQNVGCRQTPIRRHPNPGLPSLQSCEENVPATAFSLQQPKRTETASQFACPSPPGGHLGFFQLLVIISKAAMCRFRVTISFQLLWQISKNTGTGLCNKSLSRFLRNHKTIFQCGRAVLHSRHNDREFLSLHILTSTRCGSFFFFFTGIKIQLFQNHL